MQYLSREQVRKIDGYAINTLGIPGVVLMENAGRNASEHILEAARNRNASEVVIVCGSGNNGGDGFVIARHLLNAGTKTKTFLVGSEDKLTDDARVNHDILRNMNEPIHGFPEGHLSEHIQPTSLLVDALLGTGFSGDVREPLATTIREMNNTRGAGIVAVDVPSGLDCNTGKPSNATIKADFTVTFVAEKTGYQHQGASGYTGTVHVADIGCPPWVSRKLFS